MYKTYPLARKAPKPRKRGSASQLSEGPSKRKKLDHSADFTTQRYSDEAFLWAEAADLDALLLLQAGSSNPTNVWGNSKDSTLRKVCNAYNHEATSEDGGTSPSYVTSACSASVRIVQASNHLDTSATNDS